MSDLSQLTTDQLSTIKSIDPTIAKWFVIVGGLISIFQSVSSWINTRKTKKNTEETKKNTQVNSQTACLLQNQTEEISKAKDDAVGSIKKSAEDFHRMFSESKNEIVSEIRKAKVDFMKVNDKTLSQLSNIPKIQDAIAHLESRQKSTEETANSTDKKLDSLLQGLERIKNAK